MILYLEIPKESNEKSSEINETAQEKSWRHDKYSKITSYSFYYSSNSKLENGLGGAFATITTGTSKNNFNYKKVILKKIIGIYWEIWKTN